MNTDEWIVGSGRPCKDEGGEEWPWGLMAVLAAIVIAAFSFAFLSGAWGVHRYPVGQPKELLTVSTKDMQLTTYTDLSVNIIGQRMEINFDPNTNTLSSDRNAEDTLRLLYLAIASCSTEVQLRMPKDINEPMKVVFGD